MMNEQKLWEMAKEMKNKKSKLNKKRLMEMIAKHTPIHGRKDKQGNWEIVSPERKKFEKDFEEYLKKQGL